MKYIGFYTLPELKKRNLDVAASAQTKMNYIISCLCNKMNNVQVISAAWTLNKSGYWKQEKVSISKNGTFVSLATLGARHKWMVIPRILFMWFKLLQYLLKNTEKNETILVYHSLYIMFPIWLATKLKRLKLVLEVEEIYADVLENRKIRNIEISYLKQASAFIFSTELLNSKINETGKPYVICNGTYQSEPECVPLKSVERTTHIVYAGTLDIRKGGAVAAAVAAEYLPSGYHIHILGFGSEPDVAKMRELVNEIDSKSEASVTYDGVLMGEDYIKFIQSCDIGLSTQNPDAAFNDTSFPSKILSYMANGLRVVSIRIAAVENSEIGDLVTYYDIQSPEEIAKAIKSIDMNTEYNSRERIEQLDKEFQKKLGLMLEEMRNAVS